MVYYLILCRSLTYAQRASHVLERAGITSIITKAPTEFSEQGCGYSVKVSEKRIADSLKLLRGAGITPIKVIVHYADGVFSEAGI